jgi:flagellar hook-associated protein 2
MATNFVSALGAGSGMDVKQLALDLVSAEKTPRKDMLDKKIASSKAEITGYGGDLRGLAVI